MKKKNILKAFVILAVIGLISAGAVYRFVINKPHKDIAKAKPAYIISATDLFDVFHSDREMAEQKFNGQVVLLNGKLDKIESSESLVTGVFVFDQGIFGDEGVRCTMLPDHAGELTSVGEGSEISLKGFLTGYNDTDVILEQCSVVR